MDYKAFFISIVMCLSLILYPNISAGSAGFGLHSGYGVLKFKEKENYSGTFYDSESEQKVILFGGSFEYSFHNRWRNFYTGVTTDWAMGIKDKEEWLSGNAQIQTNDIETFGQFYDLRLGYKISSGRLYYRTHISGGWDNLRFRREEVFQRGTRINDSTEDIRLWRVGLGTGFGYSLGKWALDGRAAYSYYPDGKTADTSISNLSFRTTGTCLDAGFGIARSITERINFYFGMSYTLQKLKGSALVIAPDKMTSWKSKMEIIVGMLNLTYVF
jgi:hypothetical protein